MCGIYGILGKNYKNIEKIFSEELHHRGPDDKGIYRDDNISLLLGHTRLSIVDLTEKGHRPMIDDSNNFVIVFNGEIYNFKELRKELRNRGYTFKTNTDTEVVLKSYIEWGTECLHKFRGMFAFCIYNKKLSELFIARDRFGIKPIIYSFLGDQFVFSSELRPIVKSNILPLRFSNE